MTARARIGKALAALAAEPPRRGPAACSQEPEADLGKPAKDQPTITHTHTWDGPRNLPDWLHQEDGHLVLPGRDDDTQPRPGWMLVRWSDGLITVASPQVAARAFGPDGIHGRLQRAEAELRQHAENESADAAAGSYAGSSEHAIAHPEPWLHVTFTSPDPTTANTSALALRDHLAAEFDGIHMRITTNAVEAESVIVCTTACDEQHVYDWTCALFAGGDGAWKRLEARAFNAVLPALRGCGERLPLSARRVVAKAVLAELRPELAALAAEQSAPTTAKNPPAPREQLYDAIEHEMYEYRERTMLWGETEGVTEEIARLATRGALSILQANAAPIRDLIDTALRTTPRAGCADWPAREAHGHGHRYDMRCALCAGEADTLTDAIHAALQPRLAALAAYENAITWHTNCLNCARLLDSGIRETERAEKAEAALREVLAAADAPTHCHEHPTTWDGGGPCAYCTALASARAVLDRPRTESSVHVYLSTGCYHGDHAYCQSMTGLAGAKRPGECKKCAAKCICLCHREEQR